MPYPNVLSYGHDTSGISQESVVARKTVRNQLRGKWQQDEDFFQRFFPVNTQIRKTSSKSKERFYQQAEQNHKWRGIQRGTRVVGPRLYTALNDLLNGILGCFMPNYNEQQPRRFIRTYRRKVLPDVNKAIWPALLLAGAGGYFLKQTTIRPVADYRSAISPLEVISESANVEMARERLATMVQAIFNEQTNRRFVFGLVISPSTLTCCLFDHSGVVFSPTLDYHDYPDQFCALIAGLASTDPIRIGLDTTMFIDNYSRTYLRTREYTRSRAGSIIGYLIVEKIYHAPRILGRGTTCFLALRPDDHDDHDDRKTKYVIKDAWVPADDPELEGRDSESVLLLHAKSKGVVRGVAQICHSEDVRSKRTSGKFLVDDIYNIRQLKTWERSLVRQLVHTRIVMSTYGKPFEEFSSRRELLAAYYDAVRAHRNLYEKAGILHRDIKPGNILINPGAEEGDRGILIDFDHAIRTDNTSPYSMRRKIGTYPFMSSNALLGNSLHGYLDDLESFYYVLVYMLTKFHGPHSPKQKEFPSDLSEWQGPLASSFKSGQILEDDHLININLWFGAPFRILVDRLHALFRARQWAAVRAQETPSLNDSDGDAEAEELTAHLRDPMQDSDEFLSHVRDALAELDQDEANRDDTTPAGVRAPIEEESETGATPNLYSRTQKGTKIDHVATLASFRSLRKNVNYGPLK